MVLFKWLLLLYFLVTTEVKDVTKSCFSNAIQTNHLIFTQQLHKQRSHYPQWSVTIPWLVLNQYCFISLDYLWSVYIPHQLLENNPTSCFFLVLAAIPLPFWPSYFNSIQSICLAENSFFLLVLKLTRPSNVLIFLSKYFHTLFGDSLQSPIYALHLLGAWISG